MSEPAAELPQDPSALISFGPLELVARQLVEGLMMGRHRSPFKGSSVEFVEHRKYYPGDEIRHIDWRAYGKTGRYYIKEFEDETNLRIHLLVDASGSMKYAGRSASKFDVARLLAAALAWLMLTQRDSVGLITFDSQVREQLKPSSSRDQFQRITDLLKSTTPGTETGIADVMQRVLPELPRRGLVILVSDCFDSVEALRLVFQQCRHWKHELVVFRIVAPEEEQFPFERPTQFESYEQPGHRIAVDPARLRREYLRQYREFSLTLEADCGALGIDYRRILTSEPLQQSLGGWLAERMSAQSGRRNFSG